MEEQSTEWFTLYKYIWNKIKTWFTKSGINRLMEICMANGAI